MSRVVLVTARWGESDGESGAVLRLWREPSRRELEVEVVALGHDGAGPPRRRKRTLDSVFVVHEVTASKADRVHTGLLRAALARTPGGGFPDIAGPRLARARREAGRAASASMIRALEPDSVVLAGPETWWLPRSAPVRRSDPARWCRSHCSATIRSAISRSFGHS